MHIDGSTFLGALLRRHPDARRALRRLGADLAEVDELTLLDLCEREGIDLGAAVRAVADAVDAGRQIEDPDEPWIPPTSRRFWS